MIGTKLRPLIGNPDMEHVSTSYAERHNLTMRMSMKRFGRLTNAFSKKIDNHSHALAIYFVWYNRMKLHKAHRQTPAMAAGLTDKLLDWKDIVEMIDAQERQVLLQKRQLLLAAEYTRQRRAGTRSQRQRVRHVGHARIQGKQCAQNHRAISDSQRC